MIQKKELKKHIQKMDKKSIDDNCALVKIAIALTKTEGYGDLIKQEVLEEEHNNDSSEQLDISINSSQAESVDSQGNTVSKRQNRKTR